MTVSEMLERMRDPLGAPFFPEVFRALLLLTWVVHIFFVTVAAGTSVLALYGFARKRDNELRLARVAAQLTSNTIGLGIVTGIAPLLFVQVIYDPIWYTSNTLTGFWSVMFVFVVMGAYAASYLFYMRGTKDGKHIWAAVSSAGLLVFAGFVMHVLASVSVRPDKWMGWYAPDGIIDTRGISFHSVNVPRLVFLLPLQASLSLAVILLLYAWYFAKRDDADPVFLAWVAQRGRKLGLVVSPLYALAGFGWGLTEGRELATGWIVATALSALGLGLAVFFARLSEPGSAGPKAALVWGLGLLVVAGVREYVRAASLGRFGYSVADYPYSLDWGSVTLFVGTTVPGVAALAYLIRVMYQSGLRSTGGEISGGVTALGKVTTKLLASWFAFFFGLGLLAVFVLN